MPELPEVETIKTQLENLIVGKKIIAIKTTDPKMVMPSLEVMQKAIVGTKITKVLRRAKLIQFILDNNRIIIGHLKLTGRFLVRKKTDSIDDWQRITISLSNGLELRLSDLRKFGWLKLVKDNSELKKILSKYGPEANLLRQDEFNQICLSTKRPIKVVLMDQTKISGIGNIYAVDALNLAKIDPQRPSNILDVEEQKRLLIAVNKVLKAGIKYGGASDQFYLDALGKKGHYQDYFLVYNRAGKKCFNCDGLIKKIKLAGRGTYYCPNCQK